MKTLIQKLTEAIGPSGYEDAVRDLIHAETRQYADSLSVDAMGNLIVIKGKKAAHGMKIMLAAHMDEIGIMATHIDEKGFVRFTTLGGVRPHTLMGGRVQFINGTFGVIGMEKMDKPTDLAPLDRLFVDVGATSKADCPVKVGDPAGFVRPFMELGRRLVAKSMDDRIACAILVEVLHKVKETPNELCFVFSTQEEVGLRGATAAAYGIDPDLAISVDVTATGDTPRGTRMEVSLGKGPAIKVRDSGMLSDPRLVRLMTESATRIKLPYQMEVLEAGTTDAYAMQLTRAGVPAGCISIPCRYIHSPSEMVDYSDVQNAVRLLVEIISNPVNL
jgi:putative aminopeptidase FrvX